MAQLALLALADGTVFVGESIGAAGASQGELVFNTALTGYQEILSDPSYAGQIVTLTYPHIGNTGVNDDDMEAAVIHAAGLVVRDAPVRYSNFRATGDLRGFLQDRKVVAIAGIDTRALTRRLREKGAQNAVIVAGERAGDVAAAVALARAFPGLDGLDLAKVVSTPRSYVWGEGLWETEAPPARYHVVAYDFGVKRNILRSLAHAGCRVTVVPAQTPAAQVLALRPDGVFLSNGPGDPKACGYAIDATQELVASGVPLFGICLGHQLLGLALGGRTVKMKFGHHGANHPVLDIDSGRVLITSQNHGFAVDEMSLPGCLRVTHRSLFDGSVQGLIHTDRPVFSFQGHPEASPGPHDVWPLFARFTALMDAAQNGVTRS
ncbi:glutamine-hydrolyzing carbamoyl-phosphate synthase small subunit [Acidiferrobacter thiooxydans]|uniref:Carbamoyl phosphate synthase small chain n=1 Tax=Acidiferrobacter thiooxydans TaxID=163359 RepID=A0A1C2G1B2_9GAMM|nr:glutamine-hydrolyzing carbamoyl-phosphate synthase small subunit [Acidiferrobacter thiooxydans]RCN57203.1 carbamoyl-phosphate synthase small subunit [Acidiferrobacter thiooxydans]